MDFEVARYYSHRDFTLGLLFCLGPDRRFLAYTLEDEHRDEKLPGETCIPAGRYKLALRRHGGFHARYLSRHGPAWHRGMIEVCDVPGFSDILIHVGNTDRDTAGCLLVGTGTDSRKGFVGNSTDAYRLVYPVLRDAVEAGESWITYRDLA